MKSPFSKTLIRTYIRIVASALNFKHAPWIVHSELAQQHSLPTQMPSALQQLIAAKTAPKRKSTLLKEPKPESLIQALTLDPIAQPKLKYPCDDQLLLLCGKTENERLLDFDSFWTRIHSIGVNVNVDLEDEKYANMAFADFNELFDDDEDADAERGLMRHRQLNA